MIRVVKVFGSGRVHRVKGQNLVEPLIVMFGPKNDSMHKNRDSPIFSGQRIKLGRTRPFLTTLNTNIRLQTNYSKCITGQARVRIPPKFP